MLKASKPALVIIGMHRSGTSATTGSLQLLGVQLGKKLYKGHKNINAKGYFEHSDIADTNDEILHSIGSSWDDILVKKEENWPALPQVAVHRKQLNSYIKRDFSNTELWGIKDPRICRLLPLWLDIFKENNISPRFLFVIRSPEDVYRSLNRRDGFSREKSYLLWSLHYLEALINTQGFKRSFISFDEFLENPGAQLTKVEKELELEFPTPINCVAKELDSFISQDLRHHQNLDTSIDKTSNIIKLTLILEDKLKKISQNREFEYSLNTTDIKDSLDQIYNSFPPMLVEHITTLSKQQGNYKLALNRLYRSWSIPFGKPIRLLERFLGKNI